MNFSKQHHIPECPELYAKHENLRMSARYLHGRLKIPYPYLRAILGELSRKRLIEGMKGRNGGFKLSRDKSIIFLADIIEATEGLESFSKCIMGSTNVHLIMVV